MVGQYRYRRNVKSLVITATLVIAGCQEPLVIPGGAGPASYQPRIIEFAFDPPQVPQGASSRLTWRTQYADRVHITELGDVPASGSRRFSPTPGLIYRITATNRNGMADAEITGSVGYAPQIYEPDPSGSNSIGTNPTGPPISGPLPDDQGGTIGPNPVGPPIMPPMDRDLRPAAPTLQAPGQQPATTLPDNRPQLQQRQLQRLQRMQELQPLQPMQP